MANDRLTDLTDEEIYEIAAANPRVSKAITDRDPRVGLFERVYGSDKKLGNKTFREVIEDMGVEVAPDSTIARARRHARAEIQDDVTAIKELRAQLEGEKQAQGYQTFRESLHARAVELGFTADAKELDEIIVFMRDNEYGPKSAAVAVEKFYESKGAAEPNFESENTFTFEDESSDYMKKLLGAGPGEDTSMLTMQHAERVYRDMFGAQDKKTGRRAPAFSA